MLVKVALHLFSSDFALAFALTEYEYSFIPGSTMAFAKEKYSRDSIEHNMSPMAYVNYGYIRISLLLY